MKTSNKMLLGLVIAIFVILIVQLALQKDFLKTEKTELNQAVPESITSE